MRIVETDNFNGDYPNEKFLNIPNHISYEQAQNICNTINEACSSDRAPRWWKVVDNDYKLKIGFEP